MVTPNRQLRWRWVLALTLLLWTPLALADLQVAAQRQSMAIGETLGLTISSNDGLDLSALDLSPIEADFQILSRSSSTSISLINGVRTNQMALQLELSPRRSGVLSIPQLSLSGQSSQPLQIQVSAAAQVNPSLDRSRDFILEVEVDTETPYVQQQIRYSVKLYFAISLSDGNLSEPTSDSALIERMGQDASYRTQIDGRTYQVVERHYAITPQSSGTLSIAPVTLNGRQSRGRGFFDRGQPISLASREVLLEVKPRPPGYGADPWLPARSLALTESIGSAPARVGEPLTRTLNLAAVGIPESLLPTLQMPATDRYQVYPDQPARNGSSQDGWLIAELEQKIAIVPSQPGTLELPAIEVRWWDVTSDEMKTARVEASTIEVLPGASPTSTPAPAADGALAPSSAPQSSTAAGQSAPGKFTRDGYFWAGIFAGMWLLTLILWLRDRRGRAMPTADIGGQPPAAGISAARRAMAQACKANDPTAAERAALDLFRARGGNSLPSAMALAQSLPEGEARNALASLDRVRFSNGEQAWNGSALLDAVDQITPPVTRATTPGSGLPPLYAGRPH